MIGASFPHTLQGLFSRGCGCRLGFLGYLPRPVPAQGESFQEGCRCPDAQCGLCKSLDDHRRPRYPVMVW